LRDDLAACILDDVAACRVKRIGAAFNDIGLVDAYNQVVTDNVVDVVNTSLSRCEYEEVLLAFAVQPILEQGAVQGIAFESVSFGGVNACGIPDVLFPLVPADTEDLAAQRSVSRQTNNTSAPVCAIGTPSHLGGIVPWQQHFS
jgi:hypothetical protein